MLMKRALGGNSIGFLDRLTDRLKMGDGLKMSDFGLGDELGDELGHDLGGQKTPGWQFNFLAA